MSNGETFFAGQAAPVALLARIEQIVRTRTAHRDASIIQFRRDGEGHGIVLYRRPEEFQPYVVHRYAWLTKSGEPIGSGGILYSGGYHDTYENAVVDFARRLAES